ncbi:MAG: methylenetetrahydrofolate--tRNA-(uracil(54)-C(5))-methyltransferase (FADH(2)-oxidizing) TrmFO [Syntrophales bacterium]|jgi:methylenetetrahydrofolate--tRNA-(uracil-5-)-methyltransferase|nr:methylenetetrahydrofolate--tRNA-(uracil(54)-C(5))-methyltransferase (FADH(2)-oxidizing) TrmFO [Syntrophales bacterium]
MISRNKPEHGDNRAIIIGGGLAGCEAAWQLLSRGYGVNLYEMKPGRYSPAHRIPHLGELVCSNSLRSNQRENAVGLLKEEMRHFDSLTMRAADATRILAGSALAVDRLKFARFIEESLSACPGFNLVREEITHIPDTGMVLIASGPLTSEGLSQSLAELTGSEYLYFYDAISPIIDAETIDYERTFFASRYDKGARDYLNCPMTEETYHRFRDALSTAEVVPLKSFEDMKCFEGCLPIEVLAARGMHTLLFGPMKAIGLTDPKTGRSPYAVVQLRRENAGGTLFNMVGFQTKLTYPEQLRIFRAIPGLEEAEFVRYGSVHRNTYLHAPQLLTKTLQLRKDKRVFVSGQITGVEGYVESAATGLWAGISMSASLSGGEISPPPPTTAIGALIHHITRQDLHDFQPMNVNFGLFTPLEQRRIPKRYRGSHYADRALSDIRLWKETLNKKPLLDIPLNGDCPEDRVS